MEAVCITFQKEVSEPLTFPSFRFFKSLKLVAVDELHYYTGLFGRLFDPIAQQSISDHSPILVTLHR